MLTQTLAALALSAVAFAQAGEHHTVMVGGSGKVFTPSNVKAAIGDVIEFKFAPGAANQNHTVTQSTFAKPCERMQNGTTQGFDSGFMPVPAGSDPNNAPMFLYNVTSTDAIWFYCAQGPHCSLGMVGAVNAKEDGPKSFDAFKTKAMATAGNNTGSAPTYAMPSDLPQVPSSATVLKQSAFAIIAALIAVVA